MKYVKLFAVFVLCLTAFCGVSEAAEFSLNLASWEDYALAEVQAAIEAEADVNTKASGDGGTPLIYAADNGNP